MLQRGKDEFEKSESEIAEEKNRYLHCQTVMLSIGDSNGVTELWPPESLVTSQLRCIKWSSFFVVSKVDPSFVGAKGRLSFLFLPSW